LAVADSTKADLDELSTYLFRNQSIQGIYYPSDAFWVQFSNSYSIIGSGSPLTDNQMDKYKHLMKLADDALVLIAEFYDGSWELFRKVVEAENLSLFGE